MLSGEERCLMIEEEATRVPISADVGVGGFGVMGLLSVSFNVSSTKAALRPSVLTTSLPFIRLLNVFFGRLSTLNGPS